MLLWDVVLDCKSPFVIIFDYCFVLYLLRVARCPACPDLHLAAKAQAGHVGASNLCSLALQYSEAWALGRTSRLARLVRGGENRAQSRGDDSRASLLAFFLDHMSYHDNDSAQEPGMTREDHGSLVLPPIMPNPDHSNRLPLGPARHPSTSRNHTK